MTSEEYAAVIDGYYNVIERKFMRGELDEEIYEMIAHKLFEWMRLYRHKEEEGCST